MQMVFLLPIGISSVLLFATGQMISNGFAGLPREKARNLGYYIVSLTGLSSILLLIEAAIDDEIWNFSILLPAVFSVLLIIVLVYFLRSKQYRNDPNKTSSTHSYLYRAIFISLLNLGSVLAFWYFH